MQRRRLRAIVSASLALWLAACGAPADILYAEGGWVRAMPPGATSTAAYFMLHNGTGSAVRIERITAPGFASVRLHETAMTDGTMRMREAGPIELEPGESVTLAPGGLHLMLTGAESPLSTGDTAELTFWAGGAAALTLTLPAARENPHDRKD